MVAKGWFGIVMGILWIIGAWFIQSDKSAQEMNDIRENGYSYVGESQLTQEQYDNIKQYKGFHGGTVEITNVSPLTIKYSIATLDYIDYLQIKNWDWNSKGFPLTASRVFPIMMFAIGVFQLFMGFTSLGGAKSKEKISKETVGK
jgi:hypothetical protein